MALIFISASDEFIKLIVFNWDTPLSVILVSELCNLIMLIMFNCVI